MRERRVAPQQPPKPPTDVTRAISVRQRGSHVRLKHPDHPISLVVPLHRELKRGTLAGILRDAGVDGDELRRLL